MKLASLALFVLFIPTIAAAQNSGIFIQAGPLADFVFAPSAMGGIIVGTDAILQDGYGTTSYSVGL